VIRLQIIEILELNQGRVCESDLSFEMNNTEEDIRKALDSLQAIGMISICGDQITWG
jgi:transcription initiation factor IIE alpha subunit